MKLLSLLPRVRILRRFRRTLVGLKRRPRREGDSRTGGFRRTLVGLKPPPLVLAENHHKFQTYPRGVEATSSSLVTPARRSFRRTLVGLKPATRTGNSASVAGFRRTLVGLKQGDGPGLIGTLGRFRRTLVGLKPMNSGMSARPSVRFRRTLVGLKLVARGRFGIDRVVSDVPSWG